MKTLNFKSVLISITFTVCVVIYIFFSEFGEEVDCIKVTKGDIKDSVTGNVHVLAEQTYQLKSSQHGTVSMVAKLPLAKSISVEKNQVILQLDTSDLNRSLKQALTNKSHFVQKIKIDSVYGLELDIEQYELDALTKFSKGDHISIADLNRKKSQVNRLKTQVGREKISNDEILFELNTKIENLESIIDKMTIRSPIKGQLINSFVSPGDLVSTGQQIGTIISNERIIQASLNEEDFFGLTEGLPAAVSLFSLGEEVIEANVSRLSSSVDTLSGRRFVYLKMNNRTNFLPTGASGRVEIIKNRKKGRIIIPTKALIGNSVFTLKDNKAISKKVKIGARNFSTVEIIDGLKEGEFVIIGTPHLLSEGQSVQPRYLK
ncbi:MAG: efflux RND transporter periplasmic adaptor subunit [Opitutae bacterium]|mgnify:FL=1|jgi:RND family efflux transporter MFP subunit|nr:efflux RND transporter periplasmic adaptor subunit [Opitutae bacterium]